MKWASYAIKFEVNEAGNVHYLTKTFVVKAQIFEQVSTSFAQTANWDYPAKYQVSSGFPVQFDQLDSNKYPIVHVQFDAQFFGDKDKTEYPKTLYITLQKDDQLPFTAHSDYIKSIQRYQIDFDLRYLIKDLINGDYKVVAHIEDHRALKAHKFDVGILYVNFNEGSNERTNFGVREDYKLLEKITNYFPPEEPEKGPLVPLVFCVAIVSLFLYYVG